MDKEKDNLEDISKSGIPFLIKGKKYFIGVLTIRDLADFRQYIKGGKIILIQKTVRDSQERVKLIEQVLNGSVDEDKEITTMDGICFLLWCALKKNHKDLTLEDVDNLVDLSNIAEVSTVLTQLGGIVNPPFQVEKKKIK